MKGELARDKVRCPNPFGPRSYSAAIPLAKSAWSARMRLRSSGIIAGQNAREVSGRAGLSARSSPESSRLVERCLNSRAFALLLLARRNRA